MTSSKIEMPGEVKADPAALMASLHLLPAPALNLEIKHTKVSGVPGAGGDRPLPRGRGLPRPGRASPAPLERQKSRPAGPAEAAGCVSPGATRKPSGSEQSERERLDLPVPLLSCLQRLLSSGAPCSREQPRLPHSISVAPDRNQRKLLYTPALRNRKIKMFSFLN